MCDCSNCANAIWDCFEYYGTTKKNWFVNDCKLGLDESEDCEGYEEAFVGNVERLLKKIREEADGKEKQHGSLGIQQHRKHRRDCQKEQH